VLSRPRWIAGHVLVTVLVVAFVALGFWQVSRNNEKHDKDAAAKAKLGAPAPTLTSLAEPITNGTRVEVRGTFDPEAEVLLRGRTCESASGDDVLTVLRLDDGGAVIVDRGCLPHVSITHDIDAARAPTGPVTVRGTVAASRALQLDEDVGDLAGRPALPRVDVDAVATATGTDGLRNEWISAQYIDPAPGAGAPQLPQPPPSDDVNHMQYAFQWFAFALIGIVGWPVILTRVRRRKVHSAENVTGD
jgi:cytochrome oxidase assembly protein ShyY1